MKLRTTANRTEIAFSVNRLYTVADALVTKFFSRFGVPCVLHTDQGRDFDSHLFQHICELLVVHKTRTSPY